MSDEAPPLECDSYEIEWDKNACMSVCLSVCLVTVCLVTVAKVQFDHLRLIKSSGDMNMLRLTLLAAVVALGAAFQHSGVQRARSISRTTTSWTTTPLMAKTKAKTKANKSKAANVKGANKPLETSLKHTAEKMVDATEPAATATAPAPAPTAPPAKRSLDAEAEARLKARREAREAGRPR